MKTGAMGIKLVKLSEGLRLERYWDAGHGWTIGYGHLIKKGENLVTITDEQATELLVHDLAWAESAVDSLTEYDLEQKEFDALVDFVYNLGIVNFKGSTLLKQINADNFDAAANEFEKWDHNNGEVVEGLETRRMRERDLFLTGNFT